MIIPWNLLFGFSLIFFYIVLGFFRNEKLLRKGIELINIAHDLHTKEFHNNFMNTNYQFTECYYDVIRKEFGPYSKLLLCIWIDLNKRRIDTEAKMRKLFEERNKGEAGLQE